MLYYLILYYLFTSAVGFSTIFALYFSMKKYHFFEHQLHKKQICCYLWSAIFYAILVFSFSIMNYVLMIKENAKGEYFESRFIQCAMKKDPMIVILTVLRAIVSELHISDILFCFSIIVIKPSDDVLQGLNKLDDLIKVSCF